MKIKILSIILIALFLGGCNNFDYVNKGSEGYPPINPAPTKNNLQIILYYTDKENSYLVPESRIVSFSKESTGEMAIKELLKKPKRSGFSNLIPSDTKLLSFDIIKGVAYVNLSDSFINDIYTEKQEALLIYSIVNTLTRLEGINQVQILVEGQLKHQYKYYDLSNPLKQSTILINNEYRSPIDVVSEYYTNLLKGDFEEISKLMKFSKRNNIRSDEFQAYFQESNNELNNYKIKNYKISNYGNNLNITVDIELYSYDNLIKEVKNQSFYMVYENGEFKIDVIDRNF